MNKRNAIRWAEEQAKMFRNTLWYVTKIGKKFECVSLNFFEYNPDNLWYYNTNEKIKYWRGKKWEFI